MAVYKTAYTIADALRSYDQDIAFLEAQVLRFPGRIFDLIQQREQRLRIEQQRRQQGLRKSSPLSQLNLSQVTA